MSDHKARENGRVLEISCGLLLEY